MTSDPNDPEIEEEGETEETDAEEAERTGLAGLLERFPVFDRIGEFLNRRSIPYVQGLASLECGPACLSMLLQSMGKQVGVVELRSLIDPSSGSSAQGLIDAAAVYGLRGRGVSLQMDQLEYLEPGSILFWEFNHFVVFERLGKKHVDIVDPALGKRRIPLEKFSTAFTGVALLFEATHEFEAGGERVGFLKKYMLRVLQDRQLFSGLLISSLLLQLFSLAVPVLTGLVVEKVVPRADYQLLGVVGAGLATVVGVYFLGTLVRSHLLILMRTRFDARLTPTLIEHLTRLPYTFFQQRRPDDIVYRLQSASYLRESMSSAALSAFLDGFFVLVYLGLLMFVSPFLGLVVAVLGVLQVSLFGFSRAEQARLSAEAIEAEGKSATSISEMVHGIETLKAMGIERRAVEDWAQLYVDLANAQLERAKLNVVLDALNVSIRLGAPMFTLAIGAVQVIRGELSLGTMLALNALAVGILFPLANLVTTAMDLQNVSLHAERIDDIFNTAPEQLSRNKRKAPQLAGAVKLDKVTFRYTPLSAPAVREVSLEVAPGEFIAVVGKSGSGKSTLAKLLAGLYLPHSGQLFFDGLAFEELDLESVRLQMGFVPQRPFFMSGSVRANIANLDREVSFERIQEAAQRAHVHQDILAMPMGYETMMIGDGGTLSGGQRQRVALARALVRNPRLILLDEATSALDTLSERRIQRELEQMACTRIVVAHRLSTIIEADQILVMDAGQLVDRGTHEELLNRSGLYADLMAAQEQ